MNENIGSKGKGNDYRRVLKNIERKKMKLREQAKKNRPKKKRVVQIMDSNYSFEPDSKSGASTNSAITAKSCFGFSYAS